MYKKTYLHADREKSLLRAHPWIFSKAIDRYDDTLVSGDITEVYDASGNYLATGVFSRHSQIAIRVLSFKKQCIDYDFIYAKIKRALSLREDLLPPGNDGIRLIASEGDGMPGLIVDKYNSHLVISISSYAMEVMRDNIIKALRSLLPDMSIYERSDTSARKKEGLEKRNTLIYGTEPSDVIYVRENNDIFMPIDIKNGHKTGGYLDQRASRLRLSQIVKGKSVLNCFCYTGCFGLWALKGRASRVINVDVSAHALSLAKDGVIYNHLDPGRCKFIKEDVFTYLRKEIELGHSYDVIVLDPPKFVQSQSTLKSGCRGYQDINRLAMQLVSDGGRLLTFSCSGLMHSDLFQKIVSDAALEADVEARIIGTLRQDKDHVVLSSCPESFYLKGLELVIYKK